MLRRASTCAAAFAVVAASIAGAPPAGTAHASGTRAAEAAAPTHIYWSVSLGVGKNSVIGRMNLDGSDPHPRFIRTGRDHPWALAISGDWIYFTTKQPYGTSRIGRVRLNGSDLQPDLVTATAAGVIGLAVTKHAIYWGNYTSIGRATLTGHSVQQNFVHVPAEGLAISGNSIYYSYHAGGVPGIGGVGAIGRVSTSGHGVDPHFATGLYGVPTLAVTAGYLYWYTSSSYVSAGVLGRERLSGGGEQSRLHRYAPDGPGCPVGMIAADTGNLFFPNFVDLTETDLTGHVTNRVLGPANMGACGVAVGP